MKRSEQEIESRLARLVDLYLAGDLEREQYEREKTVCYDQLAALRPAGYAVMMNAGETLERFETLRSTANTLEKRNCCDLHSQQSSFGASLSELSNSGKLFTPLFHTGMDGTTGATGHAYTAAMSVYFPIPQQCPRVPDLRLPRFSDP